MLIRGEHKIRPGSVLIVIRRIFRDRDIQEVALGLHSLVTQIQSWMNASGEEDTSKRQTDEYVGAL